MADWARSLQSGFQTGLQFGEALRKRREREAYEEIMKETPTQQYSPEQAAQLEAIQGAINPETGQPYYQVSATPGGLNYQVTPNFQYEGSTNAPATISPGYGLLGRTYETMPTESQISSARMNRMADVAAQFGNPAEAQRMRLAASQEERAARGFETGEQLKGLQIGEAQRKADFNTNLQSVMAKDYDTPEAKTAAILDVYRSYDPVVASQLESNYTKADLDKITLRAAKLKEGFTTARTKGVDALIKWYDDVNDGFTLTREGDTIYQIDASGARSVFAKGDDKTIIDQVTKLAQPETFLALSKAEADIESAKATTAYRNAQIGALGTGLSDRNALRLSTASTALGRQLEDLDKRLADPMARLTQQQREELRKQRNLVSTQLASTNNQLMTTLGITLPPPAPELKVGDIVEVGGESRRYKGGPVNDQKSYEPVAAGAGAGGGLRKEETAPRTAQPTLRTSTGETIGILTPESRIVSDLARGDTATLQYVENLLQSPYGSQRLSNAALEAAARAGSRTAQRELNLRLQMQ